MPFEEGRGPLGEVVDGLQIADAGAMRSFMVGGEDAEDMSARADERSGLDGADACIKDSFQNRMAKKDGAVGDVFHNDAGASLRGEAADTVAGGDGRAMKEEGRGESFRDVKAQETGGAIEELDIAHASAGTGDGGVKNPGEHFVAVAAAEFAVMGELFHLGTCGLARVRGVPASELGLEPNAARFLAGAGDAFHRFAAREGCVAEWRVCHMKLGRWSA